ncbi:MAG: amino acid adenylation domain-containing protein, partial [Micromonosporaceae bacterium]|nr:amino acid adenylation domain-containing protein [Micromonosporaceae bacterium]
YAGQRDFCVGTSISGRHQVELEPLVGLFSNTIVLRADLSGAPTFRELVRRTRATALEAFGHQDIPFEQLLTELQVERDLSRSPIFDVMFTVQNFTTGGGFAPEGLAVTQFEAGIEQAKYDLAVELWTTGDALSAQFNYNTDLYDGVTAERMAGHYRRLLRAAVAAPDTPMAALPLLSSAERERLLVEWNDTGCPLPDDSPVSAAVEEQARSRPDAVAVVAGDRAYSYAELVAAGREVAARLRAAGVGQGDLVGLCAPRSFAAVAGMLGVWLARAAYVPLDVSHPEERLRFLTGDCGARVLLTVDGLRDRLGWFAGDVLTLDDPSGPSGPDGPPPAPDPTPEQAAGTGADLAYVIYTSGSTGIPKGVAVEHRSVRNLLDSMRGILDAGPDDVWLGLTSLSFDISTLELMLPLCTGGRTVLVPDRDVADGRALATLVRGHGVTHVQATPSSWQLLVEADFTAPAVVALSGGETLPAPLAAEICGRVKRLYNVYGPTETTIWSTVAEIPDGAGTAPIGRPLGNTRCYVLDESGNPVPVGVPGELLIGGAGLARGYPGRPGLTAQRFAPDPYGPPGARLYRTGDRVRWRADGQLEHIGRWDNQVKLRGHRIELGEIESVLIALPDVARAAVVVREDVPGDRKLVGYLAAAGGEPDVERLRRDLAARLPSHLVPSALVLLDALPTTPNGKLDRSALPAPARDRDVPRRDTCDPVAEAVARIWCEVLGLDHVGPDEDLFDLGGHSLTITQIAARIRDRLGADVPLHVFYDESTVSAIAAAVRRIRR